MHGQQHIKKPMETSNIANLESCGKVPQQSSYALHPYASQSWTERSRVKTSKTLKWH